MFLHWSNLNDGHLGCNLYDCTERKCLMTNQDFENYRLPRKMDVDSFRDILLAMCLLAVLKWQLCWVIRGSEHKALKPSIFLASGISSIPYVMVLSGNWPNQVKGKLTLRKGVLHRPVTSLTLQNVYQRIQCRMRWHWTGSGKRNLPGPIYINEKHYHCS